MPGDLLAQDISIARSPHDPSPLMSETTLQPATPADIPYLVDRLKRFSNEVGFIPQSNLEWLVAHGTVWIARLNEQPAGAIVCSAGIRKPLCFRANLVERELWDRGLGTMLTRWLSGRSQSIAWGGLRVRTRTDLQRQIRINENTGGRITAIHAAGARGHAVQEWWLPAAISQESLVPGTYLPSDQVTRTQQGRSGGCHSGKTAPPEPVRAGLPPATRRDDPRL